VSRGGSASPPGSHSVWDSRSDLRDFNDFPVGFRHNA
jgi:hypothetical protein